MRGTQKYPQCGLGIPKRPQHQWEPHSCSHWAETSTLLGVPENPLSLGVMCSLNPPSLGGAAQKTPSHRCRPPRTRLCAALITCRGSLGGWRSLSGSSRAPSRGRPGQCGDVRQERAVPALCPAEAEGGGGCSRCAAHQPGHQSDSPPGSAGPRHREALWEHLLSAAGWRCQCPGHADGP